MELFNIVIADNEINNLKALVRTLRGEYNIFTALSIDDMFEIMSQNEIALVLINYRIPGIDKPETLETIYSKYPGIICMMLIAYSDEEKIANTLKTGCIFGYITKPWEPEEVKAIIREGVEAYALKNSFRETNIRALFDNGLITREQLEVALSVQQTEQKPLSEILLKYCMVSEELIEKALQLQKIDGKEFEDILTENESITPANLEKAKELQKHEKKKITNIFVNLGYITEDDIYSCYASSLGMPYIPLSLFASNIASEHKYLERLIFRYEIIPIKQVGKILVFAASEPLSNKAKKEIEKETGYKIMTFCTSYEEIRSFLKEFCKTEKNAVSQ